MTLGPDKPNMFLDPPPSPFHNYQEDAIILEEHIAKLSRELLVAQENAALFKSALETLSKNVEEEALVAEDGWDSGNSPCYVQTFVDIVLSKEKCTECGEIKGTKSGSYCLTCGRING